MSLREFLSINKVSRAIYFDERSGKFCPRAYSAVEIARKTNEAFAAFGKAAKE